MELFESPHEILRIFVPQYSADLVYRKAGILQEQIRFLEAGLAQQLGEGTAEEFLNVSGAVGDCVPPPDGTRGSRRTEPENPIPKASAARLAAFSFVRLYGIVRTVRSGFPMVKIPVLGWCHFMHLFKSPCKILRIFVAKHFADLIYCKAGIT